VAESNADIRKTKQERTMNLNRLFILGALAFLASCATADRVKALEEKVASLEEKIESVAKSGGKAKPKDEKAEKAAAALYEAIGKAVRDGDTAGAKTKLAEMKKKYSSTTAYRRARKIERELEVIGKAAPPSLDVEKWYTAEATIDFASDKPTLLVFWEIWCPHCRREVPKMQATWDKYKGKIQMVGLTKITRSATEEKVTEFLKENKVSYPTAKENGDLSKHFNVSGIPAAAVVKGGKIVWRGHPGRLSDEMIEGWL
jgi:thiol-disulfide isomerase/thioredoxin